MSKVEAELLDQAIARLAAARVKFADRTPSQPTIEGVTRDINYAAAILEDPQAYGFWALPKEKECQA